MRVLLVLAGAVLIASAVARAQNPIPEKFTNLQVLSKAITRTELVSIMKNFALNLGVRCEHCHVGEGNDLSKFDFAADTRAAKGVARRMLRMTAALNETLKDIGEPPVAGASKITCFTCHRGAVKPLAAAGK